MRSLLLNLFLLIFTFFAAMSLWAVAKVYPHQDSTRRKMWKILHIWSGTMLWAVRVILNGKVEIRGKEHLKPGVSQLIVGKHQSELDVILMVNELDDFSAVVMAELEKLPFFPTLLRALDLVMVKVDEGRQGRTQQIIEGGIRTVAQGRDMLIYPEGELMRLGAKERYRSGVGNLYTNMNVEVVPVAFSVGVIWPRRDWTKRANQRGVMEFMEPIQPGLPFDEFMALIEERIETRTMELIRESAPPEVLAEAEALHARGANNHN
ncbi:1-acyl-sn-glycerol-3-phosphate acyltransferase [Rhodobacteraceae bacterium NNCM2]|nr:1-acyl-sn-glycerol-3-phosphate acyltransferase [Coraliihabitans acroporae]